MDDINKDERFKHIPTDSRFRVMPKKDRKFKVDNRFRKMFHDKSFKLKYTVDKRGRPMNLTSSDNLKKFYELSSESEDDEKSDSEKKTDDITNVSGESESSSEEEEDSLKVANEVPDEQSKSASESASESSDSSDGDDTTSESGIDDDDDEIPWNEFDKDTVRSDEISHRLAMCNMDWDRIKASDLFVLLNSFKPTNGVIRSVKIYMSDYGKERIDYEKLHGPKELTETSTKETNSKPNEADTKTNSNGIKADENSEIPVFKHNSYDDDDDGDNLNRKKLRAYQFNRLKYYYAVVDCDCEDTANKIYTECDGMEYESSCTRLDLRFVPDTEAFDQEPTDSCIESPDPITYKPNLFFTTALNQTKVECTWDETPRDRLAITMKKYTEDDLKNNNAFKNVLASSESESDAENDNEETDKIIGNAADGVGRSVEASESDEDEEEKKMRKYRSLLLGVEEKRKSKQELNMAFDWGDGVEDSAGSDDDDDLLVNKKTEKSDSNKVKKSDRKHKHLTEEEKNEEAQLSLLAMDHEDKPHFNLDDLLLENTKSKKSKKKKKLLEDKANNNKEDDFQLNIKDPRFEAIFNNHKFNIDPSDQLFKKTKAMENLMEEKNKRKIAETDLKEARKEDDDETVEKKPKHDASASLMVSSIKSKTEAMARRKKEIKDRQNKIKFSMLK